MSLGTHPPSCSMECTIYIQYSFFHIGTLDVVFKSFVEHAAGEGKKQIKSGDAKSRELCEAKCTLRPLELLQATYTYCICDRMHERSQGAGVGLLVVGVTTG